MENNIPYQVIKQITNNYDKARILGSGGFGTVYKAVHENGETIAVKVFDVPRFDDSDFRKEFDNLKRLKHKNIVELVGFCNDTEEVVYTDDNGKQIPAGKLHMALCLEYVQNGHLGDYISDKSTEHHWHTRYKIIKGVCEGLKYLREGINPPIFHLDLKPQNILLDKDMIPKVADFGLSRLFGKEKTTKTASTCGTLGYVPPEYIDYKVISEKFDIYSLGVIMVKIITGPEHFFRIGDMSRKKYINQVHDKWRKHLRQNMTSGSVGVYCQQVRRCIELALDCMKKNRYERPTIQQIISNLIETETMIGNLGLNIEQFPHGGSIEKDPNTIRRENRKSKSTTMIAPAKDLPFHFLMTITNNFSQELKDVRHKHGTVYKGFWPEGQVIAVVRFEPDSPIGRDRMFVEKVRSISELNHKNLLRIVGYCREAHRTVVQSNGRYIVADIHQTLLCYEYFPAGSLAKYFDGKSGLLDWGMKFKMIAGICEGLHFLHNELQTPIIHTDLNPETILLDNNMEPHILYFWDYEEQELYVPTILERPRMSWYTGYMAPEYLYNGEISTRADIYSLGFIILEIITGEGSRRVVEPKHASELIENVRQNWTLEQIMCMYPSMEDECYLDHVEICIKIGLYCAQIDQKKRPSIVHIIDKLNILSKEGEYYRMQEELVKYELLEVHPLDLCFPFEPKKSISCSLQLRNKGDDHVAFMLESDTPNRYLTKLPLCGIVPHRCTYTHTITMRKQLKQKSGELLTLHTVAVSKSDLQDVDEGSIAKEYGKFFNEAKEERHGGHEVQVVTLTVNCDPLVQEPTRPTFEIITTPNALEVSSIDVHPTEPWIMTASKGNLHVWNYKTMETLVPFKDIINDTVHVAKFVAREKWLVAGDDNGFIHVYSYDEHDEVELFDAHYRSITSLAVHPTCPFLLSSSNDEDNLIMLWDWDNNWQCTRTFSGHADKVMQVIFNSNSMGNFTTASFDGTVKIWSVDKDDADVILDEKNGKLLCVDNFERYNVQHLIAGCMDGTAQIWNMEKGCVSKLEGHKQRIAAVNLHPELPLLITGSFDGTVRLWSSDTYKLEDIIDFNLGHVYAFGFIKDLRRIVVGCQQGMATMEIPMRL